MADGDPFPRAPGRSGGARAGAAGGRRSGGGGARLRAGRAGRLGGAEPRRPAPVRAGRFVVHGAHDRARVPVNAIGIEIEAALAFGTGHHGTTRGCLLALERLAKRRRMRHVLDLGTGSGVLAIAAAKSVARAGRRQRHRPAAVDGRARQCAAQPRGALDHASCTPPAPRRRAIAARQALRSDLRQYPARAAAAAGGADRRGSPRAARMSCCPACCRRRPMPCWRSIARKGWRSSAASCWKAG